MHQVSVWVVAMALALGCAAPAYPQATPPPGSPIALKQHPRVFFTQSELPALRQRLATHYKSDLQAFINLLNDLSKLTSGQRDIEVNWGGMNYAFLAVLDPQQMSSLGFSFQAPLNTPRAYCERAMSYTRQQLPAIAASQGQGGGSLATGYPTPVYVSALTTYDWCYPHLTDAERREIVDAYIAAYKKQYAGKDLLKVEVEGSAMLAFDRGTNDLEDILGIVAFYGDSYPDLPLQSELYNAFHQVWLNRYFVELQHFYGDGTMWHESSGGYLSNAVTSLAYSVGAFISAIGREQLNNYKFFTRFPEFGFALVRPNGLNKTCGSSGDANCPKYFDNWGVISTGIAGPSCKNTVFIAGLLQRMNHPNAALGRGLIERMSSDHCETTINRYGGRWSNHVLFKFIFGTKDVEGKQPDEAGVAKDNRFGLGQFVFRSGWNADATQVVFHGREHMMYGHHSPEYGTFSLHKFGNLIVQAANGKSGEGAFSGVPQSAPSTGMLFENLVTVHRGASDPGLSIRGSGPIDSLFGSRGISDIRKAGSVFASLLSNPDFAYVGYENHSRWAPDVVNLSERELVYIRGPLNSEYLVVGDRINALSPQTDEKIWRIWVPTQPQFVGAAASQPRVGKWTASGAAGVVVTNEQPRLKGNDYESAPTHGRFFMKTLLPADATINFIGGPGMEFQSGDDDGSTPWGTPKLSNAAREYLGWGRIEVRPSQPRNFDFFLNVFQIGDSKSMGNMASIRRLSDGGDMLVGTHIADPANEWVVFFAERQRGEVSGAQYTFAAASASSRHLLLDMLPNTAFYVRSTEAQGGMSVSVSTTPNGGSTVQSNADGVVTFSLSGQHIVAAVTPEAPQNLRPF